MSDPVVGMEVSALVGLSAVTTASGLQGAQIVAALQNQGVKATMEAPAGLDATFNRSSVPEQSMTRAAVAPTPDLANDFSRRP